MAPDVNNSFTQLIKEAAELSFIQMSGRHRDCVASFADEQITSKGEHITGAINDEHSAQTDRVVDKSNHGSGNQPSALQSRNQQAIGLDEFRFRRQLLDESIH